MTRVLAYIRYLRKGLSALVTVLVSAGGIAVLFPDLSGPTAASATGILAVLAAVLVPANGPKPGTPVADEPVNPNMQG